MVFFRDFRGIPFAPAPLLVAVFSFSRAAAVTVFLPGARSVRNERFFRCDHGLASEAAGYFAGESFIVVTAGRFLLLSFHD